MKTPLTLAALTFAAGLLLSGLSNVSRAETGSARGGAGDLVKRAPAAVAVQKQTSTAHCELAKPDCALCQTVTGTQTVTEGKNNVSKTVPVQKHLCPSCKTSLQTSGHGKAAQQTVAHTCKMAAASAKGCCAK